MRTFKNKYQAPQIISQGSAVTMTASTTSGSCYDGSPFTSDHCPCSGVGNSCKKDPD